MTVRLRNVSPLGDIEVPLLRRVVKADEEFEVADDIAGTESSEWHKATAKDPAWCCRVNEETGEVEAYTPGSGLLATANFVRVTETKKKSTADQAATPTAIED